MNKTISKPTLAVNREHWVDCLKGFAMLAVLIAHSANFITYPKFVVPLTYFCVTLFVVLSGYNCFGSYKKAYESGQLKNPLFDKSWTWRRVKSVLFPYLTAAIILSVFAHGKFDLIPAVNDVLTFQNGTHLYFVCFFLEIMLFSCPLCFFYYSLKRNIYIYQL
ncbi:hypothetical protein FACS1894125_1340 [Actinomycetota bacterium]|nr:hypothetical protein FACS1894125_1340 [Actinomycetota bacterium]